MANAAIAGTNLADAGTISASSQQILLAVQNLLQSDIEVRWRSLTNTDFVVLDLGAATTFDTLLLKGMTVGASATVRARVSTIDSSGAAGDGFDSGVLLSGATPYFDASYGCFAYPLSAPVTARYVRFDLSDPDAAYVQVGRLAVMLRTTFTINFSYGWQVQWVDRSTSQESRGGQTLIWKDNTYRTLDVTFDNVEPSERYGIVETIDKANGQHTDILIIIDTDSENIARDSIFGLASTLTPAVQSVFDRFSKQYQIKERL